MREKELIDEVAVAATRRQVLLGCALAAGGVALRSWAATPVTAAAAVQDGGISRTAESIHQEPLFTASRNRVYEALTDSAEFDKIVQLSGVMQGAESKVPTTINPVAGGAFALFGGYISGRQVELLPGELIVQAWRAGSWGAGLYSIARFQLTTQGGGSKIIFDHRGFPNGQAEHLAAGWYANYWIPLAKLLAQ